MGKLISTNWMSLDGYIAGPQGEMDFILSDDEMSEYELGLVGGADTLALGRRTYTDFSGYWPKVLDNPNAAPFERQYAERVNALLKVAFSRTLQQSLWDETEFIREISPETVQPLKAGAGDVVMYGSAQVVKELARQGLVDEFHFLMHPLTLGGGTSLLGDLGQRVKLEQVEARPFRSGVVLLVYRPA